MPKVTVWVREDDLAEFEAIEDRPEWLHRAIREIPAKKAQRQDIYKGRDWSSQDDMWPEKVKAPQPKPPVAKKPTRYEPDTYVDPNDMP